MSYEQDLERLIAEVESMTQTQRLVFIELLFKSFRPHELPQFISRFEVAAGRARLVKNIDLVKPTRKSPSKKT